MMRAEPREASCTATSPPATVTRICPPGIDTTLAFLPMHPRGTDHCLPAALTSIVGGTTCSVTSPTIDSSSAALPIGRRCSFSRRNSAAGGRPVVSLGSELLLDSIRAIASSRPSSPTKSPS